MVALQITKTTLGGFSRLLTLEHHIDDNEFPYLAIPLSKRRSWSLVLRLVCFYGRYVREIPGVLCIGATQDTKPYSWISKVSFPPRTSIYNPDHSSVMLSCPFRNHLLGVLSPVSPSHWMAYTSSDPFVARWCRESACVYRILVFAGLETSVLYF